MFASLSRPQWRRISRQTNTLLYKNFLVFSKSPLTTLARALIFPLAVTLILCFLKGLNIYRNQSIPSGIASSPTPVADLPDAINHSGLRKLVFVRNGISNETLNPIIDGIFGLPGMEHIEKHSPDDPNELYNLCKQTITGFSDCFAAVIFESFEDSSVNYTIAVDPGTVNSYQSGNPADDNSITATLLLPLQWALDSHIGNFTTAPKPLLNPYSGVFGGKVDPYAALRARQPSFWLGTISSFTAPLFVLILIGITYHLSTFVATERQTTMSELMSAQMVTTVPRIVSTITSFFILYFPGLIICSILLTQLLFTHTSDILMLFIMLLAGASFTISSHFLASFFSKAQLAGLYVSVLTFALALVALSVTLSYGTDKSPQVTALGLLFPPTTFTLVILEIANVEYNFKAFSLLSAMAGDGTITGTVSVLASDKLQILDGYMYLIFFVVQIIGYGAATYAIEQRLWGVTRTFEKIDAASDIALRCTNLSKTFTTKRPWYRPFKAKAAPLAAVDHLNLEVKKGSVNFLLGPNGCGKTTTLRCISGMSSMDAGSRLELNEAGLVFGICPQSNVLWENLTVEEHIKIWRKLKTAAFEDLTVDDYDDVLGECDLVGKAKARAKTLSGGQMRKLQLAIAFVGGSKVCCIDEASSGLDPLSRRNIWNIIQTGHSRRTILLTTHFLDEADILADHIAIVYKGKLVCEGPGTSLKARFGDDYVIRSDSDTGGDMVWRLSTSAEAARKVLELEALSDDATCVFPTLEQVFLKVTSDTAILERAGDGIVGTEQETTDVIDEKIFALEQDESREIDLEMGRSIGWLRQVYALFSKRYMLFLQRATWIAYGINLIIPVIIAGALFKYIHHTAQPLQTCQMNKIIMRAAPFQQSLHSSSLPPIAGTYPFLPYDAQVRLSPATFDVSSGNNYTTVIGPATEWSGSVQDALYVSSLNGLQVILGSIEVGSDPTSNNQTQAELLLGSRSFVNSTTNLVRSLSNVAGLGFSGFGIFAPTPESATLFYETSSEMMYVNMEAFGLITNRIGSSMKNGTARRITASLRSMTNVQSTVDFRSMPIAVLLTLAFITAASIAVIYPAFEKINRVRALHFCNGVSPSALWVAYLLFDTQFIVVQAIIVYGLMFAGSVSNLWYEPGYLIGAFVLFGIATYLGTYVLSLFVKKAAFAIAAGVHIVLFVLYLAAYIMNQSFGSVRNQFRISLNIQYGLGLSSPGANLGRAFFLATNSFDILCGKYGDADVANGFAFDRFGGVYLNLLIQILFLFAVLMIYEYGSANWIRRNITHRGVPARLHYIVDSTEAAATEHAVPASDAEKTTISTTVAPAPILSVSRVSKFFGRVFATENISFKILPNETLALLGSNGAGKTTMINMIRGELKPDYGDIFVDGVSVLRDAHKARLQMGVCPQDDAVDNLTVEQTLRFYAKVKGLRDVDGNVQKVMEALNIAFYRGLQVRALSGGTKRKLSVAIALLGNPRILLLDEPSTGQDAGAKRILWRALQSIRSNRAILISTHSMEEAEALASSVAIMGTRMLATGTLFELQETHGGSYSIRAVRVQNGGEDGKLRAERAITEAFEREGLSVRGYEDRLGQVSFKLAHDKHALGKIMTVMEGLKGSPIVDESTERDLGARAGAGGSSVVAVGGSSSAAAAASARFRIIQDYTITPPTLEETFMNVAREAGGDGIA